MKKWWSNPDNQITFFFATLLTLALLTGTTPVISLPNIIAFVLYCFGIYILYLFRKSTKKQNDQGNK